MLRAIRVIQQGRRYICGDVAANLTNALINKSDNVETSLAPHLGPRERQVLQLIAEGYTSVQIAVNLNIASGTVDVHRRNLMHKLNLHGVAELTRYAIRNGFTSG